ncbi:MAG TPA: hypothetical protein VMU64_02425 [Acidimicrobiales bacterium]|nr:hypothetical protein [Acidimicrobiales bacterium]
MSGVSGPITTDRRVPPAPEPGGGGASPWYKRRAFLVAAGVIVVVGAAVVSDLPTPTSPASDAMAENAVIKQINFDVAPCLFSVREALTLYGDETSGTLNSGHRAQIPSLLRDDQTACSYTNDNIFQLSDIAGPGSAAGKEVDQAVNTVTVWATSDALAAIEAIQALTSRPGDRKARNQLHGDERLLTEDRNKATAEIDAAGHILGTRLATLDVSTESLPVVSGPTTSS